MFGMVGKCLHPGRGTFPNGKTHPQAPFGIFLILQAPESILHSRGIVEGETPPRRAANEGQLSWLGDKTSPQSHCTKSPASPSGHCHQAQDGSQGQDTGFGQPQAQLKADFSQGFA